jgi:deoxycytidylate deaminase
MMNRYAEIALNIADSKSMAYDHKHGAVCIYGNRIISSGYNHPENPHWIKVSEKVFQV